MKKILILGAGIYQVPLIKEAKKQGLYVLVASIKGNYPGFELADKIYYENTTSKEEILKIAINEKIDAITTTGTDVAIETIGYICDRLNLKGISEKSALLSTNKALMKNAFLENNVRTAKYFQISNVQELKKAYVKSNKPVILKVVDSSGSRGIVKVEKEEELETVFYELMKQTKKDYLLLEEFIEGKEFGAQALIIDSKIKFIMPHGDILFHGKTDVPIGHFVPYNLSKKVNDDLICQIENSIQALELNNCVINADFILCNDKIYVLEIGARAGATNLVELTSIYYDMNYYKIILDLSLGNNINNVFNQTNSCSSMLLFSRKTGILENVIDKNINVKYYEFQLDYNNKDKVKEFEVGPDRLGHIIIKSQKYKEEDLIEEILEISRNIDIEVK